MSDHREPEGRGPSAPAPDGGPLGLDASSRATLREVGHMLRSPLGSIVMMADTLCSDRGNCLDDVALHRLRIIQRAALGLAATAGDLLVLGGGDESREPEPFSVDDTVGAVGDVLRAVLEARGSELIVESAVPGKRVGPAAILTRVLAGISIRMAVAVRDGQLGISAREASAGAVSFELTAEGEDLFGDLDEADPIAPFRSGAAWDSRTLSADGLGFLAARELLRSVGSELRLDFATGTRARVDFQLTLPTAG